MLIHVRMREEPDGELQAKLTKARDRYLQDRTPENRAAYRLALQQFADSVLRGLSPRVEDAGEDQEKRRRSG